MEDPKRKEKTFEAKEVENNSRGWFFSKGPDDNYQNMG